MYVFDTGSFIEIFKFYPKRFVTLWRLFHELIQSGRIISAIGVYDEINDREEKMNEWKAKNKELFLKPLPEEAVFISEIYKAKNGHFQQNIPESARLRGLKVADPFVIASAKVRCATVVTEEKYKANSSKIPNICEHFGILYTNLEGFMEKEGWEF